MITIKTNKNVNIQNLSVVFFNKTSVNFVDSMSYYIISDEPLTSFNASFSENLSNYFSFFLISGDDIIELNTLQLSDLTEINQSGKYIYSFNLKFTPFEVEKEQFELFKSNIKLNISTSTETKEIIFQTVGEAEAMSERLVVTLQNFKKYMDEDYMIAFNNSNPKAKDFDYTIYNQKIREYLMNIFDLSVLHGSYKNLFSVLKFFGYGEMLDLKEYWVDNAGNYKSTTIYNVVLEYLDKSLAGFKKTNMMSLVYQINQEDGIDSDGLPTYVNVFDATDNILLKMNALKRILEKDFLHFNTHIVDIIGEFQVVVGQELNVLSNLAFVTNVNISDNLNVPVSFDIESENIFIGSNSVYVNPFMFEPTSDQSELDFLPDIVNYDDFDIFPFLRIPDGITYADFDILTRLYTGTFAYLKCTLDYEIQRYQSCRVLITDITNNIVYDSEVKPIDFLGYDFYLAFRNKGNYSVIIYLIDHYNNATVCGSKNINVVEPSIDIFLGKFTEEVDENKVKLLDEWSTYETNSDDYYLVPSIQNNFDINTWNPETNTPTLDIIRHYKKDYTKLSTYSLVNQLNSILIEKLNGIPLYSWGSTYAVGIIDIIGDKTVDGNRSFVIHLVNDNLSEKIKVGKYWNNTDDEIVWLTELLEDIKDTITENENSIYSDFTYDIEYYTNISNPDDGGIISSARPMLRIRSIEASYKSRIFNIEINTQPNTDFLDSFFIEDEIVFSNVDAKLEFGLLEPTISDLYIIIDNKTFRIEENFEINSLQDLADYIQSDTELKNIFFVSDVSDTIKIYSTNDVILMHDSIGMQSDIVRGKQFKYAQVLKKGQSVQVGQPFLASITKTSKFDVGNIKWKLFDELTNETISEQTGLVFKYILSKESTYSLEVDYTLNGIEKNEVLRGIILCHTEL